MADPAESTETTPLGQGNLLAGERVQLLARSLEGLAERLQADLQPRINDCTVRPGPITQTTLPALCQEPSDIAVIRTSYELAFGLLVTDLGLALSMVEVLCGGKGDGEHEARPLSTVETSLMDLVLEPILSNGADQFDLGRSELCFHVASATSLPEAPPEPALALPLEFTIGSVEGAIVFGLTGSQLQTCIEKIDRRLAGQHAERRQRPNALVRQAMAPVPVELVVGFDPLPAPARQLAELQVGDVLRTGQPVTRSLVARIGAERLFTVRPAQRGQRLVAELTGRADNERGTG